MEQERLQKQLAFILEADKAKNILRQTHLSGQGRRENDAEHSWHMALMIYLLHEYANEPIDLAKTMMMAIIHDIVEIDAGDSYAYDAAAAATQAEREAKAADRIYSLLPADQAAELRALWEEFEAGVSPEARFAKAIDNFQPLILNDANAGGDWAAHKVRKAQVEKRNEATTKGSRTIRAYIQTVLDSYDASLGWAD